MATIEQLDITGPVILDPYQYDLDRPVISQPVEDVLQIRLEGEEASTFFAWVSTYWRAEFERDLQGLWTSDELGPMKTTWLPLVTLREDLCVRETPQSDLRVRELLEKLRTLMRSWRGAGVDTVYISAVEERGARA